jgi:putative peptidoglycan lipid II flippase
VNVDPQDTSRQQDSVGTRVARAGIIVAIAHMLFKFAGLITAKCMGHYIDPKTFECVYVVAFEGCLFTLFLMGEKVIGPTFLPVFMEELDTKGEREAWGFSNALLTLQFLVLLVVVFMITFAPDAVVRLLTAWDETHSPEKFHLASRSLRFMAPALLCLSLGSTTYMLLNGYKRFFLAAFGDASWKLCVLVAVLAGTGIFGMGYNTIVFGLLAGSIAKLATHLVGLRDKLHLLRPSFLWRSPTLRKMGLLMVPLLCGIVFARVRDIYNSIFILTRLEADGLIQASYFGRKIYQTIGWLVPYSLSIAIFPFLCELVDKDDYDELGGLLTRSGRMLMSVFIPFSLVCVVLATPMVSLLFKGGEFTDKAVYLTSVSMACQILVLPAYALEYLMMQAFFAKRKMVSVTLIGVSFSIISMAISYLGIVTFGATGATALAVVALGFTLSRTLKVAVLIGFLKRDVPFFPLGETVAFLFRATMTALATAGAAYACGEVFERFVSADSGKIVLLAKLAVSGVGATAAFVVACLAVRITEPLTMLKWVLNRGRGKGESPVTGDQ